MIPAIILIIIISTFTIDMSTVRTNHKLDLWNGTLSALGVAFAFGHILSILTAFIAAPITSLNPLLAAGWFAGLTEALIKRPRVNDFENLSQDIFSIKGFWKNRVTRILLVVILANIGSAIGTWIGGVEVIRIFIRTIWS